MKFNGNFTNAMKEFVIGKMSRLSSYVNCDNAAVSYKVRKDGSYKFEISIGSNIRAESSGFDFYELVPEVVSKLENQIKKYHNSKSFSKKHFDISLNELSEEDQEDEEISKEKTIILEEESFSEAIDEMELLGHQFYIYKDIDRKNTCVVYKRYDGSYGLIECR